MSDSGDDRGNSLAAESPQQPSSSRDSDHASPPPVAAAAAKPPVKAPSSQSNEQLAFDRRAWREREERVIANINPDAKRHPVLYARVVAMLRKGKIGACKSWSQVGLRHGFYKWAKEHSVDAKPDLATLLGLMAAHQTLHCQRNDMFAGLVAERKLEAWVKEVLLERNETGHGTQTDDEGEMKPVMSVEAPGPAFKAEEQNKFSVQQFAFHSESATPWPPAPLLPATYPKRHPVGNAALTRPEIGTHDPQTGLITPIKRPATRTPSTDPSPRIKRQRVAQVDQGSQTVFTGDVKSVDDPSLVNSIKELIHTTVNTTITEAFAAQTGKLEEALTAALSSESVVATIRDTAASMFGYEPVPVRNTETRRPPPANQPMRRAYPQALAAPARTVAVTRQERIYPIPEYMAYGGGGGRMAGGQMEGAEDWQLGGYY